MELLKKDLHFISRLLELNDKIIKIYDEILENDISLDNVKEQILDQNRTVELSRKMVKVTNFGNQFLSFE